MGDGERRAQPTNPSSTSWATAWRAAHVGPSGFYRTHRAEDQFKTSVHVDTSVAEALAFLIQEIRSKSPGPYFTVVDVGSGSGRLLIDLAALLPEDTVLAGVDVRERPHELPESIDWIQCSVDETTTNVTGRDGEIPGVVIAHEFLDDIPCDVLEFDDQEPRVVLVDSVTGTEYLGPQLSDPACARFIESPRAAREWVERWWPKTRPLARREVGLSRDRVWSTLRAIPSSGAAIAIDYGHLRDERVRGLWDAGTIKGFADGRPRRAIPNGSCNITAHVALDSCGGPHARLSRQSENVPVSSPSNFPYDLGAHYWLVDPVMEK